MKKLMAIIMVAVLMLSLLAGCRMKNENETTVPTVTDGKRETNRPGVDTMPDRTDTIDPSNGAGNGMVDPTNGANRDTVPNGTDATTPRNRIRPMR